MSESDPFKLDIFKPTHSARYNACVGNNSLHDMRTYAEGYLQASQILIGQIFEKELVYERDTLVHPILYSARHAIELSIKHVLIKLNQTDILTEERLLHGHSLNQLWQLFEAKIGFDRRFVEVANNICPIVSQLDQADTDAQDFRYPANSEGDQTLDGKFIVDLITVKEMIEYLNERLLYLFHLVDVVVDERKLNAFTKELNREELKQLSIDLPDINTWSESEEFEEVKARWKKQCDLSNNAFKRGVDFIKNHREFSGNINNDHDFLALDDELVIDIIKNAHEIRAEQIADRKLDDLERLKKPNLAYTNYPLFKARLTGDVVAEINALFYLSRDNELSDAFDLLFLHFGKEFSRLSGERLEEKIKRSFLHVFEKTSFIDNIVGGLRKIGKLNLVAKLENYIIVEEIDLTSLGFELYGVMDK